MVHPHYNHDPGNTRFSRDLQREVDRYLDEMIPTTIEEDAYIEEQRCTIDVDQVLDASRAGQKQRIASVRESAQSSSGVAPIRPSRKKRVGRLRSRRSYFTHVTITLSSHTRRAFHVLWHTLRF